MDGGELEFKLCLDPTDYEFGLLKIVYELTCHALGSSYVAQGAWATAPVVAGHRDRKIGIVAGGVVAWLPTMTVEHELYPRHIALRSGQMCVVQHQR